MHTEDVDRYAHSHVFHHTGELAESRTMRVALLTLVMMVAEVSAGWIFKSMALFADGWHMSTHAAALGLSWAAFVLARRYAADSRFAFGTWKIEVLGGFMSAILLGLVGVAMVIMSVQRLFHPVAIQFNQAILVAAIGLAVNLASIVLLEGVPSSHGHGHDHEHNDSGAHGHSHGHGNLNLRAAYLHVVADALTSVLAIAALLGAKFLQWNWLDPLMGIVGAALILRWTFALLRDTGSILLDREPDDALAGRIRLAIEADGDARISDLHVWRVGENRYACIVAVVAENPQPADAYKKRLQALTGLVHVSVEVTPRISTG